MSFKKIAVSTLGFGAALAMTMGGVAMAAPGAGNIDPDAKGSITLHKYSGEPVTSDAHDGTVVTGITNDPLEGVNFTLYKVDGLSVTDPGDWEDITALNNWVNAKSALGSWSPSGAKIGAAPKEYTLSNADQKTTDASGVASWGTNPSMSLALGVYLIVETGAPANVAEHTLPFLVTVPLAHNTDNDWIYDVNVYPKNALVDIEKEVTDPGTVGIGSTVDWTVTNKVPTIQRKFESYRMRDVLDARLSYNANSTVIKVGTTTLSGTGANRDYDLSVSGQELLVTFTSVGLAKLDANQGQDIVWTFDTKVVSLGTGAGAGVIPNEASVMVNKPTGDWEEDGVPSNKVSSNWGAVKIVKREDSEGTMTPLKDAVFQVFASEAHANACVAMVKTTNNSLPDASTCANAISVTRDINGVEIAAQNKFTTGTDGTVVIPGLSVGINDDTTQDYWLVEVKPPAGYINENKVYEVEVSAGSIANAAVLNVYNKQQPPTTLPRTGADVSMALLWSAAGLIILGGGVAVISRKKATQEDA